MLIVSLVVLLVPILNVLPAVPVPMAIVFALLPVPRLTLPVVPESKVMALAVVELIVRAPAAVSDVPKPVMLLELNSRPVEEKLYSSEPFTWTLKLLPVSTLRFKSPVLSRNNPTSVPAGAPVVSRKRMLERSVRSKPSASISCPQGVWEPALQDPQTGTPLTPAPERRHWLPVSVSTTLVTTPPVG